MSTFTQILDEVFAQLHEDDSDLYITLPPAQPHSTCTHRPSVQDTIISEQHQHPQHLSHEDHFQLY